ncbi:MAG: hypothetical protein HYY09_06425 [Firmicutes bacterium]|nr:hypothetical protein [Bacillota bacterium]
MFPWLAALAVHEGGHLASAVFGAPVPLELVIHPFGGQLRVGPAGSRGKEALRAALGPLANLFTAAILLTSAGIANLAPTSNGFLPAFLRANLFLGIFNLLPAFPLDGGRLVEALLIPRLGSRRAAGVSVSLGRWIGLGSAGWGLLSVAGILSGTLSLPGNWAVPLTLTGTGTYLWLLGRTVERSSHFTAVRLLLGASAMDPEKGPIRLQSFLVAGQCTPRALFTASGGSAFLAFVSADEPAGSAQCGLRLVTGKELAEGVLAGMITLDSPIRELLRLPGPWAPPLGGGPAV